MEELVKIYWDYKFANPQDLFLESFYDDNSKKNIEEKIKGFKWALENNQIIQNYKDVEKVCELFDKELLWDL